MVGTAEGMGNRFHKGPLVASGGGAQGTEITLEAGSCHLLASVSKAQPKNLNFYGFGTL